MHQAAYSRQLCFWPVPTSLLPQRCRRRKSRASSSTANRLHHHPLEYQVYYCAQGGWQSDAQATGHDRRGGRRDLEAIEGRLLYDVEEQQGELLHADDGGGEKVVRHEREGECRDVEQMRNGKVSRIRLQAMVISTAGERPHIRGDDAYRTPSARISNGEASHSARRVAHG